MEAFAKLEDPRRKAGQLHAQTLCLALFTLAVVAGNRLGSTEGRSQEGFIEEISSGGIGSGLCRS